MITGFQAAWLAFKRHLRVSEVHFFPRLICVEICNGDGGVYAAVLRGCLLAWLGG